MRVAVRQSAPGLHTSALPFVGRGEELAVLARLLRDPGTRLVTLTGVGGSGKTRLALEVAKQLAADFADGIVFVDLAPVSDPALLLTAIASALDLHEPGGQSIDRALIARLHDQRVLLILDNCEQLLPVRPELATILAACPDLTILATSRERLNLRAEQEILVQPLPLPDLRADLSLADLAANPAIALFLHRAAKSRLGFALTQENAVAIAAICHRLDGLPLAIELAAAHVKLLPPAALLARLETRLPLLIGGPRDAPARQRTLRDTVAWSHDLLTDDERRLFRRLGVFAGGWTLEAAEAIANRDDDLDVFSGMASLVDKSLVRQVDQMEDEPRFTMLETIREFALEQLRQFPQDEQSLRQAHATFFADLALAARMDISVGVPETIRHLAAEEDNFRVMLTHLLATGDAGTVLCVVGGTLVDYWAVAGGHWEEARTWLDRAFASSAPISPAAQVWGYNGLTVTSMHQSDLALCRMAATQCRDLARATGDPELAARGALSVSWVEQEEGHHEAAAQLAREAAAAARAAGDPGMQGWSLGMLGVTQLRAGDLQGATSSLEHALALFRELGGVWGESSALADLADVARTAGDLERAARLHADAVEVRRDAGDPSDAFVDLVGIAQLAQVKGRLEPAARLLGAADAYRRCYGFVGWGPASERRDQTRCALMRQLGEQRFAEAYEAGRLLTIEQAVAEALDLANELAAGSVTPLGNR